MNTFIRIIRGELVPVLLDELRADELRSAYLQLLVFMAVEDHEFKYIVPAAIHSKRRIPSAFLSVGFIRDQSACLAATDFDPYISLL